MEWFIQLHKKVCDWEWHTDIPTKTLFFHSLLKCNFKEVKWRWKIIKPWELVTSLEHLALETWLTRQQVRTAIEKLKRTWEITHYATNEHTTLALNNWESYNTQDNKRTTNEQQTNNKRITTTNKEYNEYNDNNENIDTYIPKGIWEQALDAIDKNIVPEEEKKQYWNPDINKTLAFLTKHIWCDTFAESQKLQRQYAKHILNLWKEIGSEEMKYRLDKILEDKFKAKNSNKIVFIYKELKSFIHAPETEIFKC
jgi:hypothetical protein